MKHVREDLPDVQVMRPEVSARLAAVLDRMTDKDLALRHPDAAAVEADLEDALAAEASRTGTSTGEATAVLRTLPADARRRLPLRLRMRIPVLLLVLMIAVAGSLASTSSSTEAADRAQRGTGPRHEHAAARRADRLGQADVGVRLRPARRRRGARRGGAARRRPGLRAPRGRPRPTRTTRSTKPAGSSPGVGLYIDAEPSVNGRRAGDPDARARLEDGDLRPRASAVGREWPSDDWTKLGGGTVEKRQAALRARHRATAATATTSSGSRSCRPRATTSRSRSSRCPRRRSSGRSPRVRSCGRRARRAWRSSAKPSSRSHASGHGTPRRPPTASGTPTWRHARQRVELVDEHAPVVLDEEVDARQAGAADAQERLDGQPAHARRPTRPGSARAPAARRRRRSTWPRSRTTRRRPAGRSRRARTPPARA